MNIGEWFNDAQKELKSVGIESSRLDALVLLQVVLAADKAYILSHSEIDVESDKQITLDKMLKRRLKREPLAYVVGSKEFYGLDFHVDSRALVPRLETESLVDFIVKKAPRNASVLEIGTGSGIVAITAAHERNDLHITATDISADALSLAKQNAKKHSTKINLIQSDLFDQVSGKFDVIAANLPYVPSKGNYAEELTFEPEVSLFSGIDGLNLYKKFFASIENYLNNEGLVIIEHDPVQLGKLKSLSPLVSKQVSDFVTVFRD